MNSVGRMRWWVSSGVVTAGIGAALVAGAGAAAADTGDTDTSARPTSQTADSEQTSSSSDKQSVSAEPSKADPSARPASRSKSGRDRSLSDSVKTEKQDVDTALRPKFGSKSIRDRGVHAERDDAAAVTAAPRDLRPVKVRPAPVPEAVVAPARQVSQIELAVKAVGTALRQLFDCAPPAEPAGVTVGHSGLQLAGGVTVAADWYFPDSDTEPTGVIYLQHGFFRSNANVSALAASLSRETNSVVVAPALSSNFLGTDPYWINGVQAQVAVAELFDGDRSALNASAIAAGYTGGALPQDFVLAGHSAGGNLVTAAGGYLADNRYLKGIVLLDAVDRDGDMAEGLAKLAGVPVYIIAAEPSAANAFGSGTAVLVNQRPATFVGVRLVGGTHVDAEGASTDLLGSLVAGFSQPSNVAALPTIAAGWINDMFAGTRTGLYPVGGERISVDGATAIGLGQSAARRIGMLISL